MTQHKTPYEIRLNLLQLAQVIESNRLHADSIEKQVATGTDVTHTTQAPTVDQVIECARRLNSFVSDPDKR